jgi:hypothetical protein
MTEQLKAHPDCFLLDELGFQIGAVANVTGAYAADWPEPVRILGIEKYRHGKINITIGTLDGDEPTDGFGIDDINPHPRRRTDDRASIRREAFEEAATLVETDLSGLGTGPYEIATAIRNLKETL